MRVICSWCGERQPDKAPLENTSTTHTICPGCHAEFVHQWFGVDPRQETEEEKILNCS